MFLPGGAGQDPRKPRSHQGCRGSRTASPGVLLSPDPSRCPGPLEGAGSFASPICRHVWSACGRRHCAPGTPHPAPRALRLWPPASAPPAGLRASSLRPVVTGPPQPSRGRCVLRPSARTMIVNGSDSPLMRPYSRVAVAAGLPIPHGGQMRTTQSLGQFVRCALGLVSTPWAKGRQARDEDEGTCSRSLRPGTVDSVGRGQSHSCDRVMSIGPMREARSSGYGRARAYRPRLPARGYGPRLRPTAHRSGRAGPDMVRPRSSDRGRVL